MPGAVVGFLTDRRDLRRRQRVVCEGLVFLCALAVADELEEVEALNEWMGIVIGLAMLYGGGEFLVGGSSRLARNLGLSPMVVGLTVVAFGTSSPELAAGISAVLNHSQDLVLGNVLGSNIANLGLVLGLSVLLRPIPVGREAVRRDLPVLMGSSLILALLLVLGHLSPAMGVVLLLGLIAYIYVTFRSGASLPVPRISSKRRSPRAILLALAGVAGGILLLAYGADCLVNGAVVLASNLGVSERVIGLTVVALGTSLPELSSCTIAAMKGKSDFILGNLLGSNIFNVLAILGVTSQLGTLNFSWGLFGTDMMGLIGISLLLAFFVRDGLHLARHEGILLLACYGGFLALMGS